MSNGKIQSIGRGDVSRRDFVKHSAFVVAAAAATGASAADWVSRSAHARGSDTLRVGLIGCGGRGTGAAVNALEADPSVEIAAMGDAFAERMESSLGGLMGEEAFASRVNIPQSQRFSGFDAYKGVIESGVDAVILATPPHFRPAHFMAAVKAGKHVFMEKPAGVDPVGVRSVLEAGAIAEANGLSVVAGTQRRHERKYRDMIELVHNGAIGKILSGRCYWNQGGLWHHDRKPEYSDMEWQLRNWLYFTWLSGDHIVEQHVHNLDVMNWAIGTHPVAALGMGGRQARTQPQYGHIYDHFTVEYEYPDNVSVMSMCRQTVNAASRVDEVVVGSEGIARFGDGAIDGPRSWRFDGKQTNPYVQEHVALFEGIRSGKPINEARAVAESTLTAVMGRMSAYTGQRVTWEQAMNSVLDLSPPSYEFGDLPVPEVAIPGVMKLV